MRHTALGADTIAAPVRFPASSGRALLLEVLAVCTGSPSGEPRRLRELVTAAGPRAGMKQWHRALLAAAEIIAHLRLGDAVPSGLVEALEREQGEDGGFCLMPATTAIAYTALSGTGRDRSSVRRCREYLRRGQNHDGTWRYLSFDIWDTTLMVRSLRGVPAFDEHLLRPALDFVVRTQSLDGGWACKQGIESDNDTTSSALLALAGTARARRVLPAATRYLRRAQRPDGLWTTWQSVDDIPSTDVTAHVVSAVTAHPSAAVDVSRAAEWLLAQYEESAGWSAQWYPNAAYAVAEIGEAVGWAHRASRTAARGLLDRQRPDGGWPLDPGGWWSDHAATGLALTACLRSGVRPHPPHSTTLWPSSCGSRRPTAPGAGHQPWRGPARSSTTCPCTPMPSRLRG
ncbi:prenyltransferase/squalene oxidase repeat-containing protein [Streptomyces flaveolus]|uniref:prenyltransferase/squalene oxidase repeat-containing protein n=1 Tax=Streptomyces flaveolus TaxID=67297 RepID=UPI003427174F